MTVRSRENRQNIQLHSKGDPNIDFYHIFEFFLPLNDSKVHIIHNHESIGSIALTSLWNSAQSSDSYCIIDTLDITDPDHSEEEIIAKPLLKSYYAKYHRIFDEDSKLQKLFQTLILFLLFKEL